MKSGKVKWKMRRYAYSALARETEGKRAAEKVLLLLLLLLRVVFSVRRWERRRRHSRGSICRRFGGFIHALSLPLAPMARAWLSFRPLRGCSTLAVSCVCSRSLRALHRAFPIVLKRCSHAKYYTVVVFVETFSFFLLPKLQKYWSSML